LPPGGAVPRVPAFAAAAPIVADWLGWRVFPLAQIDFATACVLASGAAVSAAGGLAAGVLAGTTAPTRVAAAIACALLDLGLYAFAVLAAAYVAVVLGI
jgi:hypothetical protein